MESAEVRTVGDVSLLANRQTDLRELFYVSGGGGSNHLKKNELN